MCSIIIYAWIFLDSTRQLFSLKRVKQLRVSYESQVFVLVRHETYKITINKITVTTHSVYWTSKSTESFLSFMLHEH